MIDSINKKSYSKNKFKRFFQKIGRGIAKGAIRAGQGIRQGINWLRTNPVGKWVGRGIKSAVSAIPGPGGVVGGIATNMVLGKE